MDDQAILLISGPNLNLLGTRQPEIYGTDTLADLERDAVATGKALGLSVVTHQSNHEGEIIDLIGWGRDHSDAIVINPGAFTHYSWAIHDALAAFDGPIVELHLSNPQARESWRHTSVVAPVATACISGLGGAGYSLAITAVAGLLEGR